MQKNTKRILSILLTISVLFCFTGVSFAEETVTVAERNSNIDSSLISPMGWYPASVIATNDGIGKKRVEVTVHLDKSYNAIAFRAGATGNPSAVFRCSVKYPNGYVRVLSSNNLVYANGSYYDYHYESSNATAGDYTFIFTMDNDNYTGCVATIYEAGYYI